MDWYFHPSYHLLRVLQIGKMGVKSARRGLANPLYVCRDHLGVSVVDTLRRSQYKALLYHNDTIGQHLFIR